MHRPRTASPGPLVCLSLAGLLASFPVDAHPTSAWVASALEKVRPDAAPGLLAPIALSAARNEFESFQVAIQGPASGVSVTATPLSGATGQIPAPRLFREVNLTLAQSSAPDGFAGEVPDALVPDVDDVVGERRNAFPFDVAAGRTSAVWVEVHVPRGATAGVYTGEVVVHAAGQADVAIPLSITVRGFALPSTSSLKSYFAVYWGDLPAQHHVSGDGLSALRARYAQLGLDHRISISGFDDGFQSDLAHFERFYGPLMNGTAPTQLEGAKLTSVMFVGDPTNTSAVRAWASFFKDPSRTGWFDRLFAYICDEPSNGAYATCGWPDITRRNAALKSVDAEFRSLVTTTVQDASENGVLAAIDVLTPVVNQLHDKPGAGPFAGAQAGKYAEFLRGSRKELWTYQSCMSHGCGGTSDYFTGWPSYMIDAAPLRARALEWLSFQWGVTGELYWETTWAYAAAGANPWASQWDFGGNGDGTLLYPGTVARIGGQTDIPVASIRLKMIREGMEDFEYLTLLARAGDPELAASLAASLFPDPWTEPSAGALLAARERMAQRIEELTGRSGAPAQPASGGAADASAAGAAATAGAPSAGAPAAATSAPGASSPPLSTATAPLPAWLTGSGCSAGTRAETIAVLGLAAARALRRRRRA